MEYQQLLFPRSSESAPLTSPLAGRHILVPESPVQALSTGGADVTRREEVSSPHGLRAEQLPCPEAILARATVRAAGACPDELGCTLEPSSRVFSPTLTSANQWHMDMPHVAHGNSYVDCSSRAGTSRLKKGGVGEGP